MSDNSATVVPATEYTVIKLETEEPSQLPLRANMNSSYEPNEERQHLVPDSEEIWRQGIIASFAEWTSAKVPKDVLDVWALLKETAETSVPTQDNVYECTLAVLGFLNITTGKPTASRNKRKTATPKSRVMKRLQYARTQNLYKKDPELLAKHVRMGTDHTVQNGQDLNKVEVKELYDALWGTSPSLRLNSPTSGPDISPDTFLNAITPDEVRRRVTRTKRSTASGPDGVKRAHVVGDHKYKLLAGLYNVIILAGSQPTQWQINRTILIPKEGKDGTKVANYRPITISSLLSRLLWGIVDQRLRKVIKMNPRQKGFVAEAGCFANVQILDELVRTMKRSGGGVGIQLDISKAFDTVLHKAIE